jgi:hypothetical protein
MMSNNLRAFGILMAWWLCLAVPASAQSEPESSAAALDVRANAMTNKLRHSYHVGDRLKVQVDSQATWIRGRLLQIQDSSLVIGENAVQISAVTRLKSTPKWGNLWLGNLMALLLLGSGFAGWLLLRAMLKKVPTVWWQWTLLGLGLVVAIALLPVLFIFALLAWAFASNNYEIGDASHLEVKR